MKERVRSQSEPVASRLLRCGLRLEEAMHDIDPRRTVPSCQIMSGRGGKTAELPRR